MARHKREAVSIVLVLAMVTAGLTSILVGQVRARAETVPAGLLDGLKHLDHQLARLIQDERNGGLDFDTANPRIHDLRDIKLGLMRGFFNQEIYGVPFSETFSELDCLDSDLFLADGVLLEAKQHWVSSNIRKHVINFLENGKKCKEKLETELRAANQSPSPSPSPSTSPSPNTPPNPFSIGATFYPAGAAGACENTSANPNNGETCYSVSTSDGDTLTYTWSLASPVQDPTCNHFHALSPPTTAVWHHADTDSCDHTKEGPNGHVGTVFAIVKDGHYTCVATYFGTNDPSTATQTGPTSTCFPRSQMVLTVGKAGIGPSSNPRATPAGNGTVTSSPSGINCGTSCQSASAGFAPNTTVTLTATPDSSSTFAGWSGGGCSGTGTCTLTMSSDQMVMATFQHM